MKQPRSNPAESAPKAPVPSAAERKKRKLASALKANLKRRKAAAKQG